MKRRVETRDVARPRYEPLRSGDPGQIVRLVQRCQRNERHQGFEDMLVDNNRRCKARAAMDDAVDDRLDPPVTVVAIDEVENRGEGGVVVASGRGRLHRSCARQRCAKPHR